MGNLLKIAYMRGLPFALLVLCSAIPALAAEPHRLAFSGRLGVEVFAEVAGSGAWCTPLLQLSLLLKADSPLLQGGVTNFISKLAPVIEQECPAAVTASVRVYEEAGRKPVGDAFVVSKVSNWGAKNPPAVDTAQAASKDPPPPASTIPAPAQNISETPPPQVASPVPLNTTPSSPPIGPASQPTPPAPVAAPKEPSTPPPLPRDLNFESALLSYLKNNPALISDTNMLSCWAMYLYGDEYRQNRGQEFKLRPILEKAGVDLQDTLNKSDGQRITATLSAQFGSYDFDKQRFPIALNFDTLAFRRTCVSVEGETVPEQFSLTIADVDAITGIPMQPDEAQAFTAKRTIRGRTDRQILIVLTLKPDAAGFAKINYGQASAQAVLESATIYGDDQAKQPIHRISEDQLATLRAARAAEKAALAKAEEERQAELRRQQMEAQQEMQRRQMMAEREQVIRNLSSSKPEVRLANWISDGIINYDLQLDNLRAARVKALATGQPAPVLMLVQADGNGSEKVSTEWPGYLEISAAPGQPELRSSSWYLIQGTLSLAPDDRLTAAQLDAKTIYECQQPKCADAMDAGAIVDRKIAAFNQVQ